MLQHAGFLLATMPTLVAPSVTGSYPGLPWGPYLADYFSAGGVGLPSMHYYTCDVGTLEAGVATAAKALPPALQSSILLGETGWVWPAHSPHPMLPPPPRTRTAACSHSPPKAP